MWSICLLNVDIFCWHTKALKKGVKKRKQVPEKGISLNILKQKKEQAVSQMEYNGNSVSLNLTIIYIINWYWIILIVWRRIETSRIYRHSCHQYEVLISGYMCMLWIFWCCERPKPKCVCMKRIDVRCGLQPWMCEKSSESKQRILKYLIWYYRWFVAYSVLTV